MVWRGNRLIVRDDRLIVRDDRLIVGDDRLIVGDDRLIVGDDWLIVGDDWLITRNARCLRTDRSREGLWRRLSCLDGLRHDILRCVAFRLIETLGNRRLWPGWRTGLTRLLNVGTRSLYDPPAGAPNRFGDFHLHDPRRRLTILEGAVRESQLGRLRGELLCLERISFGQSGFCEPNQS